MALRIGGRERTRLARGEAFGEISALLDEPVSGDLVALGPVGYIWLERERVRDFLVRHPELCFGMLQGEARRLRDPGRWYSSVASRTAEPDWAPGSWRSHPVVQQPEWPSATALELARMAGQFAKPRSASVEVVDGVELPVYRGDMVNSVEPDPAGRTPDPQRMLTAYHHAAAKLNLIRSLSTGGFGSLDQVHAWNRDFVAASPVGRRYAAIASEIGVDATRRAERRLAGHLGAHAVDRGADAGLGLGADRVPVGGQQPRRVQARPTEADLDLRYATTCDPRLNARQSLDLAFRVAEMLSARG